MVPVKVKTADSVIILEELPQLSSGEEVPEKQWYLKSHDTFNSIKGADIDAPGAWKITRGDRQIVLAIIDRGFDITHPDLNLKGKIVFPTQYNQKGERSSFKKDQFSNHGTMCTGVAVAKGKKITGVAPGCSLMPVCIPPNPTDDLLVKVFEETAVYADVICCCWSPPPVNAPISKRLYQAIKKAASIGGHQGNGTVICFSASNYNAPVNDPKNKIFYWFDANTNSIKTTRGPVLNGFASHPDVITVSASTSFNEKAAYSNWGKEISVCAPSSNYHPMVPNSRLRGHSGVWTTDNISNMIEDRDNGYTKCFGGTSCATALVAGTAALVRSANKHLTAAQVKNILQHTADKIEDRKPKMKLENVKGGYVNGHSEWFGYGKINAAKAVTLAKNINIQSI